MPAAPWLIFVRSCASILVWSLKTGRGWHWGSAITRAENPFGYYQFLLGLALPMLLSLFMAYEARWW